jgi:transposase
MSVQPRPWPEVPERTAAVARAAFPKGTLAMRVRAELPGLFADEQFVSAFGVRGKPGISPGQLALVTVLQFAENLTDRQAADAVGGRIDWKYALGLELSDPGFDHTVLTGFRQRLIDHGLDERVLDLLLARLAELGVVKAGGRQRTDLHPCARGSAISQPAGVSRRNAASSSGGAVCSHPGLAGHPHRCRMGATVWRPSRLLSAPPRRGQAHQTGRASGR